MSDPLRVVKATMRGGPMDGEQRCIRDTFEVVYRGIDPEDAARLVAGISVTAAQTVRTVEYRYRRTNDWLRDGSVVYEYQSGRALTDGRAR